MISFVIVAFACFLLVRAINRLRREEQPSRRTCRAAEELRSTEIRAG